MQAVVQLVNELPKFAKVSGDFKRMEEFEALGMNPFYLGVRRQFEGRPLGLDAPDLFIRNLNFAYDDRTILQNLDVSLAMGQKLLVLGPNGGGKSTFAHILSGLFRGAGQLQSVTSHVTSAMLEPAGFFKGTLADHIHSNKLNPGKQAYLKRLLKDFRLEDKLNKDPQYFSEGEKKKAHILLTLLKDADLYIFDEPLTAIDAPTKVMVMTHIFERTQGRLLVVILHGDETFHNHFDKVLRIGKRPVRNAQSYLNMPALSSVS